MSTSLCLPPMVMDIIHRNSESTGAKFGVNCRSQSMSIQHLGAKVGFIQGAKYFGFKLHQVILPSQNKQKMSYKA